MAESPDVIDLGRMGYEKAYAVQCAHHGEVLAARDSGHPEIGRILFVEHDPVVTISRRKGAEVHLLADEARMSAEGVAVARTDRGGDITYHGPGQIVAYPIVDLNHVGLRLIAYMRLLEEAVIRTCVDFGVNAGRDADATGVWVSDSSPPAKVCAMGVRVRRWISMHGLALNVTTNLRHFDLIVPCGLHGRSVTSFQQLLGTSCPPIEDVRTRLAGHLVECLVEARRSDVPPSQRLL